LVGVLLWRGDSDTTRWLRGAGGEVATASVLEELPPKRWEIFHDLAVPGSNANIDHLAIGPTGVWVIDSKTTRAPVCVGMLCVRFGERRLETNPVRWQAEIVGERLGVKARPLIAIHCDSPLGAPSFSRRGVRRGGVRIVLAGDLARRLKRGPRRFRRGDVESSAGEVLAHFRPASASARQNYGRD
jgi:nuclease-like protein